MYEELKERNRILVDEVELIVRPEGVRKEVNPDLNERSISERVAIVDLATGRIKQKA